MYRHLIDAILFFVAGLILSVLVASYFGDFSMATTTAILYVGAVMFARQSFKNNHLEED